MHSTLEDPLYYSDNIIELSNTSNLYKLYYPKCIY